MYNMANVRTYFMSQKHILNEFFLHTMSCGHIWKKYRIFFSGQLNFFKKIAIKIIFSKNIYAQEFALRYTLKNSINLNI